VSDLNVANRKARRLEVDADRRADFQIDEQQKDILDPSAALRRRSNLRGYAPVRSPYWAAGVLAFRCAAILELRELSADGFLWSFNSRSKARTNGLSFL
jgi:hypothetical protein